ncbi:MAG TPA: hypothetical protein VF484_00865 [Candidatus Limnocylindrales bacterium]
MTDLDTRAERLLSVGLTVAEQLREAPAAAHATLAALDRDDLIGVASMLAACVDPDRAREQLLAWFTVQPLHRDDWTESPRPLVVEWVGPPPVDVSALVAERYQLDREVAR